MKYEEKFMGPVQIKSAEIIERKTMFGKPVYKVTLMDEAVREYPEERLENLVSDEPRDWTEAVDRSTDYVVEKMLAILTEAELSIEEAKYILNTRAPLSLAVNGDRVQEKLFGKKPYEVTLVDWDQILKKDGKRRKENNDGAEQK